jgi:hypothetical protein
MTDMKSLVVSLKTAMQLRANGFPQDTYFCYTKGSKDREYFVSPSLTAFSFDDDGWYAAPTAEEILEHIRIYETTITLPNEINDCYLLDVDVYEPGNHTHFNYQTYQSTLAEAAGEMWLYLKNEEEIMEKFLNP